MYAARRTPIGHDVGYCAKGVRGISLRVIGDEQNVLNESLIEQSRQQGAPLVHEKALGSS